MTTRTVPDFFQQEDAAARRSKALWMDEQFGLDERFLSKVLHQSEAKISAWKNKRAQLPPESEETFRQLWIVVLHLLSHYNSDERLIKRLFDDPIRFVEPASPLSPPWAGSSLRAFLERGGAAAIHEVNRWVMGFRFGDPYATASSADAETCP